MEFELVKTILKNKAHIITEVDKNVKWEKVFSALKAMSVFNTTISQNEASLFICVIYIYG